MTPAVAGWIVLGVLCTAALILILVGVVQVMRSQRGLKNALARLKETQFRAFDPLRLRAALTRIGRNAETAKELVKRARLALSTIAVAIRYCAVAVRVVKLLI